MLGLIKHLVKNLRLEVVGRRESVLSAFFLAVCPASECVSENLDKSMDFKAA